MKLPVPAAVFVAAATLCIGSRHTLHAQTTLVGNPFNPQYTNWTDVFPERGSNWRVSLHTPALIDTNNANPPVSGGGTNTGLHQPNVIVANDFLAPSDYEVTARMRTNDDDLLGLVWNYLDQNNYFRVGIRQQPASGTFGATEGLAVQKIVNGVVTQISPFGPNLGFPSPITQSMIDNRTAFDLRVAVSGSNYEIFFDGNSITSGSDSDLMPGRQVGIQSWAQLLDVAAVTPPWGTEVEGFSVTQGANVLYAQTFEARPLQWRPVVMANAAGISGNTVGTTKELLGNFGNDVNDPWIQQDSNGFLNATVANTDFIGPGVVVDEPGSLDFSDYEMRVRIGAADNDGLGVLVRVQDDNNFYRITFTNENTGAGTTRAPRGMSVQKLRNGVWSELYRDDFAPLFVYSPGLAGVTPSTGLPMFDLSVQAVGNTLRIQVIDSFGATFDYPLITDSLDPLLTGTVGFHTWGTEDVYYMSYGGVDGPLLVAIPEPATSAIAMLGALACTVARRRRPAA